MDMPSPPAVGLPFWPAEDAKIRFDEVVARAASGEAQLVGTEDGQQAVVISTAAFVRLVTSSSNTTLGEAFAATKPLDLGEFEDEFDRILEEIRHPSGPSFSERVRNADGV